MVSKCCKQYLILNEFMQMKNPNLLIASDWGFVVVRIFLIVFLHVMEDILYIFIFFQFFQ